MPNHYVGAPFLRALWLVSASKVYSGLRADIVYGLIALKSALQLKAEKWVFWFFLPTAPLPEPPPGAPPHTPA